MAKAYDAELVEALLGSFGRMLGEANGRLDRLTDLMRKYPMLPAIEVLDMYEELEACEGADDE